MVWCFWLKIHLFLSSICHLVCVELDYLAAFVVAERSGCSAPGQRKAELLALHMLHSSPFSEHSFPDRVCFTQMTKVGWISQQSWLHPIYLFIYLNISFQPKDYWMLAFQVSITRGMHTFQVWCWYLMNFPSNFHTPAAANGHNIYITLGSLETLICLPSFPCTLLNRFIPRRHISSTANELHV